MQTMRIGPHQGARSGPALEFRTQAARRAGVAVAATRVSVSSTGLNVEGDASRGVGSAKNSIFSSGRQAKGPAP
jgi:hypothetical protein